MSRKRMRAVERSCAEDWCRGRLMGIVAGSALPGRITRSARRWIMHLPAGWPWAAWFELALARLRCIAYAT